MENFFNYITKPVNNEEVDIFFRSNNIIFEKLDLYFDFTYSLAKIIYDTYLGGIQEDHEIKVEMTEEDNVNHFNWCWKENIRNFEKEYILIGFEGDHYNYFNDFFKEIFYNHKDDKVKKSISEFFVDMFDRKKPFTKSDLDVILAIYRALDSNTVSIA